MAFRRESGRAYGQGGKNRGPKRDKRKATEAPAHRTPRQYRRTEQASDQRAQRQSAQRAQRRYNATMRKKAPREAAAQRKELERRDREESRRPSLIKRILRAAGDVGETAADVVTGPSSVAERVQERAGTSPTRKVRRAAGDAAKATAKAITTPTTAAERVQERAGTSPTRGVKRAVSRELRGEGEIAKGLSKAADALSKGQTPGERVMTSGFSGKAPGTRVLRATTAAGKDVINLPATVLPSLYVPADAAVKAAKGDTSAAKKLARDVKDTSVVYNVATGNLKKAARLAEEHPGLAALEVVGTKGAVGRGAGRTVRGTGSAVKSVGRRAGSAKTVRAGEKIRRVAATETRPDARVPGTPLRETRTYSRDLTNKPVQILRDRRRSRKARRLRQQAEKIESAVDRNLTPGERRRELVVDVDTESAQRLRERAAEVDPEIMGERAIQRRVDLQEARAGTRQRNRKADREAQARRIVRSSGDRGAALNLVAQGITRANVRDLRAYRDELAAVADRLGPAKRQQNRRLRQQINTSIERAEGGRLRRTDLERVAEAARVYHRDIDAPLDARLVELGLLDGEQATRARLKNVVAREGRDTEAMTTRELQQLADEMDAPPSYISQAPNMRRPGAYYTTTSREPTTQRRARTGRAVREGFDADRELLVQSAVQRENFANAAESYRQNMSEIAVRDSKSGKATPVTYDQAAKVAADMTAETGIEYVPVSFEPWRASREQRQKMREALETLDDPRAFESLRESMKKGLSGDQREGRFLVVPRAAAARAREHLDVLSPGDADRMFRQVRRQWSRTVLSTSPSYPIGNIAEAGFRAAASRSGPRSALTTRRVLKRMRELDPKQAENVINSVMTGGKITLATRRRHLDPRSLQNSPRMRRSVALVQAAMKQPVAKQASALWNAWTNVINELANGKVERGTQYAMLGRALRDAGMTDEFFKLSNKAIDQMARGLMNTAEQARMADAVVDMFGNYSRFGPTQRRFIAEYTPFAAWVISSGNFLTRVLPRDHPAAMALLVVNSRAAEDWRKAMGLDELPSWLAGSLKTSRDGTQWQVSRNTPFGAFSGNISETVGDLFLPQLLPALDALRTGRDWRGYKIPDDSAEGRAAYAIEAMAKASIPAIAVHNKGKTYFDDPGKMLTAVRQPPYKPKPKKTAKKRKVKRPADPFGGGSTGARDPFGGGGPAGADPFAP